MSALAAPRTTAQRPQTAASAYLTAAEAAALLGVNRHTLAQMRERGELSYVPHGVRRRRYLRSELDALLHRGRQTTPRAVLTEDELRAVVREEVAAALEALARLLRDSREPDRADA